MAAEKCPTREKLLQYSIGMLSETESDSLAGHLDFCPDCQATITTLEDAEDTLVGRLRAPVSGDSCLAEPQFQTAMAEAIALPNAEIGAGSERSEAPVSVSKVPVSLGEYQIIEELGHGGMGRVYKALHTKLDRVVAVKILPRGRLDERNAINRFEREMRAVGRLAHPNIVQAYDAREIDDTPVLIMEYVDGLDLAEIVHRTGPLPIADACELVRRTALALQCAHEHGLVHRDIKPSNIMLTRTGEVKLLDLGLARFYAESLPGEEMTGTGQAMGTADYMAPEQASDSRTVDIRADIYSLGCTLYKLLTGHAPFSGPEYRGTLDKMNAHVRQTAQPIQQLVENAPDKLAKILDRMLAKNPADRFAIPTEVAAAIEPFCQTASLINVIERAINSPLSGHQSEIGRERARVRAGASADIQSPTHPNTHPIPLPASARHRRNFFLVALMLAFMSAGFALGILIRINKDGKETTINIPEGSSASIDNEGQVDVTLPGQKKSNVPATVPNEKAIQGTWEIVDTTFSLIKKLPFEKDVSSDQVKKTTRVVITDNTMRIYGEHVTNLALEYRFNPYAKIPIIDLNTYGTQWGLGSFGIYKLKENTLTICASGFHMLGTEYKQSDAGVLRPTEFWAERGSDKELLVLRRVGDPIITVDEENIQGTWRVESASEHNWLGFNKNQQVCFSRRGFTFLNMPEDSPSMNDISFGYALDPLAKPKRIDIATYIDELPIKPLHGIYELSGDQLKINWSSISTDGSFKEPYLPSKLAPDDDSIFVVLKRVSEAPNKRSPPIDQLNPPKQPADSSKGEPAAKTATTFRTAKITRGDIMSTVSATGTLEPSDVVDIPSRVAGQIVSFGDDPRGATDPNLKGKMLDYNSPVEDGTVLARIDDALYKAKFQQEQAGVKRAQAELALAKAKYEQSEAKANAGQGNRDITAQPALDAAKAALEQSNAILEQAKINLERTIIKSPTKGVIIARRVNVGQKVDAGHSLFLIAKDPQNMQIWAKVNEADIGRIREGMKATFTVDAFPKEVFNAKVMQIRKDAQSTQNIVLYTVVLAFDNTDLKLMPYMTANLKFEIDSRKDVLLVPNSALRWEPMQEMFPSPLDAREGMIISRELLENQGRLWIKDKDGQHVHPIKVQRGLTDGTMTEISAPDVKEGMEVIIGSGKAESSGNELNNGLEKLFRRGENQSTNLPAINPAAELKALRGNWKVTNIEKGKHGGFWLSQSRRVTDSTINCLEINEYATEFVSFEKGDVAQLFPRFDPTATPKTIDLYSGFRSGVESTNDLKACGIYEIEGDVLKICLVNYLPLIKSDQRPKDFTIEPNSNKVVITFQRYQPSAAEKAINNDKWNLVEQINEGKLVASEELKNTFSLSFSTFHCYYRSRISSPNSWYVLDPDKEPKTIKIFPAIPIDPGQERPQKGISYGIYKLDGDRLQIAYRIDGPPPEKFESTSGSGVTLLELKRKTEQTK